LLFLSGREYRRRRTTNLLIINVSLRPSDPDRGRQRGAMLSVSHRPKLSFDLDALTLRLHSTVEEVDL
jgi:hypothetical protein